MENPIPISNLNDFEFCPISIYYHNVMGDLDRVMSQSPCQINGTAAHRSVDCNTYSTKSSIIVGKSVFCEEYGVYGKIDIFDTEAGLLTERKKKVHAVYDGQIFQLYAQLFALREEGYTVKRIRLHSMDDNRNYDIPLPEDDPAKKESFEQLIVKMRAFSPIGFVQENEEKCNHCIYRPMCGNTVRT